MKKTLLSFFCLLLVASCASRKKTDESSFLKGFFTYYNTLFNSKAALETELQNRKKSHVDNFYAPYISLLPYETADLDPSEENLGDASTMFSNGKIGTPTGNNSAQNVTILDISEAKAKKAIEKYSILKNGVEKNKMIFLAYLILAKVHLYQNTPLQTLDDLNYLFVHMKKDKRLPLARVYQAFAYSKLGDYYKSNELFLALKNDKIKKNYRKLASLFYSEMLLKSGKERAAEEELSNAYVLNKNKEVRSRISFLRGQILRNLGENEEARESFVSAYKNANDFTFEVKALVEIAKTFDSKTDDYAPAVDYITKISKKGTYESRRNEFYYALGLMAKNAGKEDEAELLFAKSAKEKISDPQIRGLDYYEIGKRYFNQDDYISAGAYYDSALAVMTYLPTKTMLQEQTTNIKKLAANYYLIKKNDSILKLTKMTVPEKISYFTTYINQLKNKEAAQAANLRRQAHQESFDTGDYNANSTFVNNSGFQNFGTNSSKTFYFANQNALSKGQSDFKQVWGDRALVDNWRTSVRNNTVQDLKNQALGTVSDKNPRRFETDFYIEKIPTNADEILLLKKARDTASLGLGRMLNQYFGKTEAATKTLFDLVEQQPEDELKLQALYLIFSMNYEKNAVAADRAKAMILKNFPYTSYAEYVKNPRDNHFLAKSSEVEKIYIQAFEAYEKSDFSAAQKIIQAAIEQYPKDGLIPKFYLLKAFITGKTAGKEIMILQLQQIALNYKNTPEAEKATSILNYLKSDLEPQNTILPNSGSEKKQNKPADLTPVTIKPVENQEPVGIGNTSSKAGPPPLIRVKKSSEK